MCDCRSYNLPDGTGSTPEVVLNHAEYFPATPRPTISVDACIADQITALWAAGIQTCGSCCGHNGVHDVAPLVYLVRPEDVPEACAVLSRSDPDRPWKVFVWSHAPQ